MRESKILLMTICATVCLSFVSCGNDKGDEPGAVGGKQCRITAVKCETTDYVYPSDEETSYYSNFQYEDDKIAGYSYDIKYGDDSTSGKSSYSYSTSTISAKKDGKTLATYTLENNLIVSGKDYWGKKWTYCYDSDNHLTEIKDKNGDILFDCEWKDGNLIAYQDKSRDKTYTITYSGQTNTLGFLPVEIYDEYLDGDDGRMLDAILCAEGYFGKMPDKFPSKVVGNGDIKQETAISYSELNKYGYPAKMVVEYFYNREHWSDTYTFSWDK